MRRVMIIGQPGAGKSWLARELGAVARLPVFHIDHIHYRPGWIERAGEEKDRLCAEVHAREEWVFEGGRSSTWPERLARADTLIWLDPPFGLRLRRVVLRTLLHYGRTRSDLPEGCREQFDPAFLGYVWRTRHSARTRMQAFYEAAPADKRRLRFASRREVRDFLAELRRAAASGNLGIPHR